jgi:putative ABC transport system permease protein
VTALAWRSLRARRTASTATVLSVLLGTTVLLAFLTLLESGLGEEVSARDREMLVTMASVVGGWGVVIVVFSVASLLGLTVRRRAEEFALLRTLGSTRRQVRGLVLREAVVLTVLAAAAGVPPGWLLGSVVLDLIQDADMVGPDVVHRMGWLSVTAAIGAMLVASVVAGLLAARTVTRSTAQAGLTAGRARRDRLGRWRITGGIVALLAGANYSVLTVTVMATSDHPYAAMSTAGPASVFWSIGAAAFAPVLLRGTAAAASPVLRLVTGGVPMHLALAHARRRSHELGGVLVPVLIFVGMSTGTLYLMEIENQTVVVHDAVGANLALVNYLVVGMIAVFAAIMVVNGTVAAIADRRREFAQQRLVGVTRAELTAVVAVEAGVLLVTAIVVGGSAALGTVIPYSVVKTDGWLSGSGPGWFLAVVAVAVLVTLGTAVAATRRAVHGVALRPPLV